MKLKPLGNRVVLQYQEVEEKTSSGIILPDSAKEKPQVAKVLAVGPGGLVDGKEVTMEGIDYIVESAEMQQEFSDEAP